MKHYKHTVTPRRSQQAQEKEAAIERHHSFNISLLFFKTFCYVTLISLLFEVFSFQILKTQQMHWNQKFRIMISLIPWDTLQMTKLIFF